MSKKLFVFDLDGTLLTPEHTILPESFEAFKAAKEKGHILAVATGRNFHLSGKVVSMVEEYVDYFVSTNGVVLNEFVGEKKSINFGHISPEAIVKVIEIVKEYPVIFSLATDDKLYTSHYLPRETLFKSNDRWRMSFEKFINVDYYTPWEDLLNAAKNEATLQFSMWTEPRHNTLLINAIRDLNLDEESFSSSATSIDVVPNGVNKWTTLQKIAEKLNINHDNVIAFGDSGNDIAMLEGAGLSFAMENASEEAKAAAKNVIGHHETPTIAEEILKLI